MWVHSLGYHGYLWWIGPERWIKLTESDGVLGIQLARDSGLNPPIPGTKEIYGWLSVRYPKAAANDPWAHSTHSYNARGFGFYIGKTVGQPRGYWRLGGRRLWIIWTPFWLPVVLTAAPPGFLAMRRFSRRRREQRRLRLGLCPICGYDLRASKDECSECGTTIDQFHRPLNDQAGTGFTLRN
jgi:hypothetical protein